MVDEIQVISSEIDGAELRRKMMKSPYYTRCDGKEDNEQIQDALDRVGRTQIFIRSEDWERIFGDN